MPTAPGSRNVPSERVVAGTGATFRPHRHVEAFHLVIKVGVCPGCKPRAVSQIPLLASAPPEASRGSGVARTPPPPPHLHLRCQAKPRAGALRAETRGGRARPGIGDCDLVCKRGPCRCREGSSDEGPSLHLMAGLPPKGREGGWRPTGAEKRQSEASEGRGGNRRVTAASRGRAPRSPQGRRLSASISSFRPPEREKKFRCSEPHGLWQCPSELVAPCPFC